jgi:hypothetical protein
MTPLEKNTYHNHELFALVAGLAIRDINAAIMARRSDDEGVPEWVKTSKLNEKHLEWVVKSCQPKLAPEANEPNR